MQPDGEERRKPAHHRLSCCSFFDGASTLTFAPELVPVLHRIVRENQAKVSFHGKDRMVEFYHVRSLAAEILSKNTGRPYSFIDADGRSHPGGWNPSHEQD